MGRFYLLGDRHVQGTRHVQEIGSIPKLLALKIVCHRRFEPRPHWHNDPRRPGAKEVAEHWVVVVDAYALIPPALAAPEVRIESEDEVFPFECLLEELRTRVKIS